MTDFTQIKSFYNNKRVLITGNTGFKGTWLTQILKSCGAELLGYSLKPPTNPSLFDILRFDEQAFLHQVYGDARDLDLMRRVFHDFRPEIVFHLAAQPIVRDSYMDPVNTYSINVMGTVNICECIRQCDSVRSFLNVTTDKVYRNNEWEWGYRETDDLDGFDPYSNSKSCSELVTHSYRDSFLKQQGVAVSTARAGNVIGGGDFSNDRILPDCVRAIQGTGIVNIRNPHSTRPYQHVLEPLFAYIMIAKMQYEDDKYSGYYNVGPDDTDCVTTGELVSCFCDFWNQRSEKKLLWNSKAEKQAPHEAGFLKLDCSKMKNTFGWRPRWHISETVEQTVSWIDTWISGENVEEEMNREIEEYLR